ncbi:MAG: CBS domain-containing protein, partial [Leptolyngbya sp. SIO1D8]|nr:CBS domain-containing protein [Leptolyngbya sp. SIO1D8]
MAKRDEVIVRYPLVVSPDVKVTDAIAQMGNSHLSCSTHRTADDLLDELSLEARSSCVLVVADEKVVGILTERDIVRLCAQQQRLDDLEIHQVMTQPVITLRESELTDLFFAINLLQQHQIRHLPILDEQQCLIGMVTHASLRQSLRPLDLLQLRLVADVMTCDVICASPHNSLLKIAQLMTEHQVSSVVIVESNDSGDDPLRRPIGIVTERDLVQFRTLELDLEGCTAAEVMSTPVFVIKPEASLVAVQQTMEQHLIRRLVVTGKRGELLGIVTQTSVLKAFNPLELYRLAQGLERKVVCLEAEKVALLQDRAVELEQQIQDRTAALKAQAERETLLAQVANRIYNSLDIQEISDTCVSEVRSFLSCDRVLVYQFQPDWSGVIVSESVDDSYSSALGNQIQDSCLQQQAATLYSSDHPIVINDIDAAGYSDCHIRLLRQYQVKANLVVPIRVSGQLWGLLIGHQCASYRDWQIEEMTLLQRISVNLAIALKQATTYQQLQVQLRDRLQAEALLRESQQRYATLAAAVPVLKQPALPSGNRFEWNISDCAVHLGYRPKSGDLTKIGKIAAQL